MGINITEAARGCRDEVITDALANINPKTGLRQVKSRAFFYCRYRQMRRGITEQGCPLLQQEVPRVCGNECLGREAEAAYEQFSRRK